VTEIEAVHNAQVVEEAQLATGPPSGGDPVPLGLLVFALRQHGPGHLTARLRALAVQGNTIMPIVFAATGLGLLITTTWAVRIGETFVQPCWVRSRPSGSATPRSLPGWPTTVYAIPPTAILHTIGEFLIAWDIVIFMLFLVSLRIPLLFSLILGAGVVGVTLITIGVLESSAGIQHAGRGVRAGVRSPGVLRLPRHGHRVGGRQAVAVRQASPEFAERKVVGLRPGLSVMRTGRGQPPLRCRGSPLRLDKDGSVREC